MDAVTDQTCVDSDDDEWYSQMEQAAFALNTAEQIQQNEQHINSSDEINETDDEYYERINTTNCALSDCTFQSEQSSVWHELMQQSLKSQQNFIDSNKSTNNELVKLLNVDVTAIQSICGFLYSNLPKSSNLFSIVSDFHSNQRSEATIFVDHLVHPAVVVAVYINSLSSRLEVALYASISGNEIKFSPLIRVLTQMLTEHGLSEYQFSSIESGVYDAFKAHNTTMDELWTDRCDMYANVDVFRDGENELVNLPPHYSFSALSESDAEIINSTWKYVTEYSIHMVRNMIDTYDCIGIRYTDPTGASQLVAWCLTYRYGALGMLYTLKEHRKKGLARAVVSELLRKSRFPLGCSSPDGPRRSSVAPPFCYIEGNNEASKALFCGQLGFTRQADVLWIGLRNKNII